METASSIESMPRIGVTGPNVYSIITLIAGVTSPSTVGVNQ